MAPTAAASFSTCALGMLAGLVWEWLREAHFRREARQRNAEVVRLESEVGHLRDRHAAPRDEVLAILDEPAPAKGAALPAVR